MMTEKGKIVCPICGHLGKRLYEFRYQFKDHTKVFSYFLCWKCQHIWLLPLPSKDELGQIYANYHTHKLEMETLIFSSLREKWLKAFLYQFYGYRHHEQPNFFWRFLALLTRIIPFLYQRAILAVNGVEGKEKGNLLDVGCGHGAFLNRLSQLSWQVTGVEPDESAARLAQEKFGLSIFCGLLEEAQFPGENFEAIVFRHSLEHISSPWAVIQECWRILKSQGKIYIFTPNSESLGHLFFKAKWRGLEPPRHFHLYSFDSINFLLKNAGFIVEEAWTTSRYASFYFLSSQGARNLPFPKLIAQGFLLLETWLLLFSPKKGEEIFIKAKKH